MLLFGLLIGMMNLHASDSINSRNSLKYQVTLPLSGMAYSVMYTSGLEVSYFQKKDTNIGFRYLDFDEPRAYEGSYKGKVLETFYKKFTGNSFYIRSTLFYREMNIDEVDDTDYVFRDLGIGFSIGNQWQWKYFTLGCDWIGINTRLATLHYEDTKRSKALFKTNGYSFTANVLNFYIGYSF
jgi:hypothetical protein